MRPKALLLAIDGLESESLRRAHTPGIDDLIRHGTYSYRAQSGDRAKSGPNWSTVLTGVWRDRHGVDSNRFVGHRLADHPDVFARVERADPDLFTAFLYSWPALHRLGEKADLRVFDPAGDCGDPCVAEAAGALLSREDPDFLLVYLQAPDQAGHADGFGPDSAPYLRAIERTDRHVQDLLARIRRRSCFASEEWLVIAVTDHGGGAKDPKGHGENAPTERDVLFVASTLRDSAPPSGPARPAPRQIDVLPTLAAHLGLPQSSYGDVDGVPLSMLVAPKVRVGVDVLVNGGFEADRGATRRGVEITPLGWRGFGCAGVERWDSALEERPHTSAHALVPRAARACEVSQDVPIEALEPRAKSLRFRLAARRAGASIPGLEITFLDGRGEPLATLPSMTDTNADEFGLIERRGTVPPAAAAARVRLMFRASGEWIDDVSLCFEAPDTKNTSDLGGCP